MITMADLSDDLGLVPEMVRLISWRITTSVCSSRYMAGGSQLGGPPFKRLLCALGRLEPAHWLTGLPTHDATNAFRAYRRDVLLQLPIESRGGFEYSLEITARAFAAGRRITEVPAASRDRTAGRSRFRILRWLPFYLRWYLFALMHHP